MISHESEIRRYEPAIVLDGWMPRTRRRTLRVFFLAIAITSGVATLALYFFSDAVRDLTIAGTLFTDTSVYGGIFVFTLSVLLSLYLISFFYNAHFYRGLEAILRDTFDDEGGITYEVAKVLHTNQSDVTKAFLESEYGTLVLLRSGIDAGDVSRFLKGNRTPIPFTAVPLETQRFVGLFDLGMFIVEHDEKFRTLIIERGKNAELFEGALRWVSRSHLAGKYHSKWWSRDNLGKHQGVGRELSFGVAYELQKYMKPITTSAVFSLFSRNSAYADEIIDKVEATLSKTRAANVMLVGEPGVGKMDILVELGNRMREGASVASIDGKRIIIFDREAFIATHNTKEEFEFSFLQLFSQAERAGNIVVVIDNIAAFLSNIESLGVDVGDLLDRFLASPFIQIISTADPSSYHENVETRAQFMSRFDTVMVENPSLESSVRILEGVAESHERKYQIFFTYPAIVSIAESADRYLVEGAMPDKAVSLLSEVAARAHQDKVSLVTKAVVERTVSERTGIPLGPVDESEKDKLLNLEDYLHKRVIGQDKAISAVSGAMRRSRAGIQNKERPLGSFLFLGSTGVGKTETAKALANVFFGSDERMSRIDMSEYNGEDAVERLIGGHAEAGTLASLLREHPYGVVLLDEFEKASSEAHNIFLQVLDEGLFTDGRGKRVNARNAIFIATSNAGSDIIWEMTGEGNDPADARDEIISSVIERNILRPELINRFDAVVVFRTLGENEQRKIAALMLEDLRKRIEKKGYQLIINDDLIEVLVGKGFNPEFGARPLRRVLQDEVEEKIASKIIAGGLSHGDTIELTTEDFLTNGDLNA